MLDYNEEWNERALSFTTLLKVKAAAATRTVILQPQRLLHRAFPTNEVGVAGVDVRQLNVDQVGDHPARQENERGALFNLLSKS